MRVLIAMTGHDGSDKALRCRAWLAGRSGSTPTVLAVAGREAERENIAAILDDASTRLRGSGLVPEPRVRVGDLGQAIADEVEASGHEIVVVGDEPRHSPWEWLCMGSSTARPVARAPCHVVVAKGAIGATGRFLLCDSGTPEVSLVERFAGQLAALVSPGDRITVLHVMSQIGAGPRVSDTDLRAGARGLLDGSAPEGEMLVRDMRFLASLDVHVIPKVRHGLVVDEILAEAREGDFGLVVIGAFRSRGWRRYLLDDLARQIIDKVDRPLLVVR